MLQQQVPSSTYILLLNPCLRVCVCVFHLVVLYFIYIHVCTRSRVYTPHKGAEPGGRRVFDLASPMPFPRMILLYITHSSVFYFSQLVYHHFCLHPTHHHSLPTHDLPYFSSLLFYLITPIGQPPGMSLTRKSNIENVFDANSPSGTGPANCWDFARTNNRSTNNKLSCITSNRGITTSKTRVVVVNVGLYGKGSERLISGVNSVFFVLVSFTCLFHLHFPFKFHFILSFFFREGQSSSYSDSNIVRI